MSVEPANTFEFDASETGAEYFDAENFEEFSGAAAQSQADENAYENLN